MYYIDKEAGKRRMTRFGYGHSYFGGGKEAEDGGHGSRNADDWGVDTSLSVSDGIVVVHQKGARSLHVFDFEKEIRVTLKLPEDESVLPGGIESVACPSATEWMLSGSSGDQSIIKFPATHDLVDGGVLHARGNATHPLADPADPTIPGWSGVFALDPADPKRPPPHMSFDPSARFAESPDDTYYTTARPRHRGGSDFCICAGKRTSETKMIAI